MSMDSYNSYHLYADTITGYARPEMGSAHPELNFDDYDRHVFLCYKSPQFWPMSFDLPNTDPLPSRLFSAFNRFDHFLHKTKLTVCGIGDGSEFSDGDVLIFPDMVRYRLDESNVAEFVRDVLVLGNVLRSLKKKWREGSYVFVCAHGTHDPRSGVCGEDIMDVLTKCIALNNVSDEVFAMPCSDIGRPELAGNAIIFSQNDYDEIEGHWYALVTSFNIYDILKRHLGGGMITAAHWRGEMGNPGTDWWGPFPKPGRSRGRPWEWKKRVETLYTKWSNWDLSAVPDCEIINQLIKDIKY